jgi:hypothetical protein
MKSDEARKPRPSKNPFAIKNAVHGFLLSASVRRPKNSISKKKFQFHVFESAGFYAVVQFCRTGRSDAGKFDLAARVGKATIAEFVDAAAGTQN